MTLESLPGLPFTRKQDLWDTYPFGLLAVPRDEVVAVHGSSGTGGRPTLVSYTRDDLDLWAQMCARALAAAGATRQASSTTPTVTGLFTGGIGIHQGAVRLGATVVPVSGGMTGRQLTLIEDLKPDILTCAPSYAIRLGEAFAEAGGHPADIGLRAGIFGAEPWSEPMRARIQRHSRPARARHLRAVRGDRPWGGVRVPGGTGRPARERGPLPGRDGRPVERRVRCQTGPRANWCSPRSRSRRCHCCGTALATLRR